MRNYNGAIALVRRTLVSYYLLDTMSWFVGCGLALYKNIIYYIIYYSDTGSSWSYPPGVPILVGCECRPRT